MSGITQDTNTTTLPNEIAALVERDPLGNPVQSIGLMHVATKEQEQKCFND